MMKKFNTSDPCEKCGGGSKAYKYCEASAYSGRFAPEHILITCLACSYTWKMECKDAPVEVTIKDRAP